MNASKIFSLIAVKISSEKISDERTAIIMGDVMIAVMILCMIVYSFGDDIFAD